ncbi:MAG: hypothetical protein VX438_06920, partial [Planctomycetota bacterium]|nr:hypothetical protein [Planctomycetota bacterium]
NHVLKRVAFSIYGNWLGITTRHQLLESKKQTTLPHKCPLERPEDLIALHNGQALLMGNRSIFRTDVAGNWNRCQLANGDRGLHWTNGCKFQDHVWLVGSPGNLVARSTDEGKTWTESRTGILTALKSIFFLDKQRGWAVGALGKIIATKDGGNSWTCQRNNDTRLGILNLASQSTSLSLDVSALLAGSYGHLYGTTLFAMNDENQPLRMDQANSRCGASTFEWRTPAEKQFLLQLVQELRMWRPSVLVINDNDAVMKRWIQKSVKSAADPDGFPELSESGLIPWKIQKIISITEDHQASQSIATNQFSGLLGRTVALQSRFAKLLIPTRSVSLSPSKLGWNEIYSTVPSTYSSQGMTTGTTAQSDPNCNRQRTQLQIDNLQQLRSISNWNQNLEQLSRMLIFSPMDEKSWLDHITAATSGMDEICYAFFLADLAQKYTKLGKPVMADSTERIILQNVDTTEVGENAIWKMIQRFGSCESNFQLNQLVRARMSIQQKGNYIDPKVQRPRDNSLFGSSGSSSGVRRVGFFEESKFDATPASFANAIRLIDTFQNRFPEINADKNIQLQIAKIKSQADNRSAINRLLDSARKNNSPSKTQIRLQREEGLSKVSGTVPGAVLAKDATREQITLDANLLESLWNPKSSEVQYALDSEYLYLAWTRKIPKPVNYDVNRQRTRDEDLTRYDRIQILLDFDRDYNSAVELSVDVRGSCQDAIWRDNQTRDFSYNPTWYIASRQEHGRWSVEAAIPLTELPAGSITVTTGWIVQSKFSSANHPEKHEHQPVSKPGLFHHEHVLIFRDPTPAD